MNLQKTKLPSNLSKFAILRVLGLPRNARWKDAADLLKYRIVRARRDGNDKDAAMWSEAKVVLKRNLKRDCSSCGRIIKPTSIYCCMCAYPLRNRRNPKTKPKALILDKFLKLDWNALAIKSRFQTGPLVKKSGISLPYLRKLFPRHFCKPLYKWLRERRQAWIAKNVHKLSRVELIQGCGLGCEQSFYRVFTRDFGMPPVAYMQGGYAKAA